MREIKFRAWHRELKHMTVGPFRFNGFDGECFYDHCARPDGDPLWYLENMEIMQYTGLKDKNGKEIYEGDVLSTHFDKTDQYEAYTEVGVVNITPHRMEIEDKKHGKYNNFYSHSEVIGNIYENPELLVKK